MLKKLKMFGAGKPSGGGYKKGGSVKKPKAMGMKNKGC